MSCFPDHFYDHLYGNKTLAASSYLVDLCFSLLCYEVKICILLRVGSSYVHPCFLLIWIHTFTLILNTNLSCRTENSDCCPDYFSHCSGEGAPSPSDKLYYQTAPAPETIHQPPSSCPHGVLDISSKNTLHCPSAHSNYSHDKIPCVSSEVTSLVTLCRIIVICVNARWDFRTV